MPINKSPINLIPLKITAYYCIICKKFHKDNSKPFIAHYDKNFDKDGKYKGERTCR